MVKYYICLLSPEAPIPVEFWNHPCFVDHEQTYIEVSPATYDESRCAGGVHYKSLYDDVPASWRPRINVAKINERMKLVLEHAPETCTLLRRVLDETEPAVQLATICNVIYELCGTGVHCAEDVTDMIVRFRHSLSYEANVRLDAYVLSLLEMRPRPDALLRVAAKFGVVSDPGARQRLRERLEGT
jgi:hypothetical protein